MRPRSWSFSEIDTLYEIDDLNQGATLGRGALAV